ncbi:kinesin-like protein KIF21A isoform X2 [Sycon ciliatum]|uniref:kinesin-like protein KIF21A isoform X2 n=1 Tax=Sycon ciliatum TaxID=27933 RepID=UPI0031F68AE6
MADESVRVSLRIRPQSARERIDLCRVCTVCTPGIEQVVLGKDKAFTYDHVYDMDTQQESLYKSSAENLVERCFEGYNATIMAYGQTGAGKTFTMGTGFDVDVGSVDLGVVPRAVEHIFNGIRSRQLAAQEASLPPPQFQLEAEFMELYNEEIVDLFDANQGNRKGLRIHEDGGRIFVAGMSSRKVSSAEQTMKTLKEGALSRTTASTSMNAQSSRSHAIFTLHITQQRLISSTSAENDEASTEQLTENGNGSELSSSPNQSSDSSTANGAGGSVDFETLSAKLHFVDLAGSERLKRTGATGDRAREGISINCGLLALGNVISALGDKSKRASHVPYRDSKLTRLLQDSLGGNSQTLMIACISPTDRDFMETLNTLKYANRARNIKNKVSVNQDKASQQISALRAEIQRLNSELEEFKTGRRSVSEDGGTIINNDQVFEISMLRAENDKMKLRVRALQDTVEQQANRLAQQQLKLDLPEAGEGEALSEDDESVSKLIGQYLREIENLKGQLLESESLAKVGPPASPYRRMSPCVSRTQSRIQHPHGASSLVGSSVPESLLLEAHSDLARMKEQQEKLVGGRSSTAGPSKKSPGSKGNSSGSNVGADARSSDEEQVEDEEPAAPASDNEVGDGSGSDSESGSSSAEDGQSLEGDIAELSSEISIKQRLIDQLQASQQQLQSMRKHYEEQLLVLQTKIRETETERDQVLTNLENRGSVSEDQVRKVRSDFEGKLKNLKSELTKMKTAKNEHQQLLRAKSRNEEKLKQLQTDLQEMKKARVKMMREMRDESAKNREQEARRAREIQQLKKTSRKHESHIKSLEAERQRRENVLRRKNEEVAMLRKQKQAAAPASSSRPATRTSSQPSSNQSMMASNTYQSQSSQRAVSAAPSGGSGGIRKRSRRVSSVFSTTGGKRKWQRLERVVNDAISQRQTLASLEQDMDRLFSERDRLGHEVKDCTRRREDAVLSMQDDVSISFQEEQLEALGAHLEYVQSNIDERQDEIMQFMEAKDEGDTVVATGLLQSCSMKEARYLLDHFLQLSITMGVQSVQHETDAKQLRGRLQQSEQQLKVREQMLLNMAADDGGDSLLRRESSPARTTAAASDSVLQISPIRPKSRPRSISNPDESGIMSALGALDATFTIPGPELLKELGTTAPTTVPTSRQAKSRDGSGGLLQPTSVSLSGSDSSLTTKDDSSMLRRPRSYTEDQRAYKQLGVSPQVMRKKDSSSSDLTSSLPGKLPVRNSEDVFKRLTNDTSSQPEVVHGSRRHGTITATAQRRGDKSQVLSCTHTVEGHSRPVTAVASSSTALFTGSQDRTAKIWDLGAGKEVVSLGGHPSSVVSVRYADKSGLVFTACQSIVKVWDVRDGQMKCVKVLGPAGNSSGTATASSSSESVNDMCLSHDESILYTTCGSSVRVWDVNKFQSLGRLVGSTAPVSTLLLLSGSHLPRDASTGSMLLATGARDHCVRIFEVNPKLANIQTACYQLEPPHYDGVQSLFEHDGQLYSGSRDHSIKQWDLASRQLRQSVNGAHNAWVCALLKVQSSSAGGQSGVLVSGCRSGMVKLWQLGTCAPNGEIAAHKQPINAMAANDGQLFTASNDRTVKVWKYRD